MTKKPKLLFLDSKKFTSRKIPPAPVLTSWKDYRDHIHTSVRLIDSFYGVSDIEWLHTYTNDLIIENLKDLVRLNGCCDLLLEDIKMLTRRGWRRE